MRRVLSIFVIILAFLTSCKLTGVKGNGDLISEERETEYFNRIDVSGNFEVEVNVGDEASLEILAESNLMKYIKTNVKKNTLYIKSKKNLRPKKDLRIVISVPKLNAIECSGVNDIHAQGINNERFDIDLSGAGSIFIEGKTNYLKIDVSGAADLMAKRLITEIVSIDVSGAANAEVFASKSCNADVSGAGYIELYGDAKDVNMDISGAGSIERK